MAALLLGGLAGMYVLYDGPEPDDAWTAVKVSSEPFAANPLGVLVEQLDSSGVQFLQLPGESGQRMPDHAVGETRELLADYAAALLMVDQALQGDSSHWRWPALEEKRYAGFMAISNLAELMKRKAEVHAVDGSVDLSASAICELVRFGHALRRASDGDPLKYSAALRVHAAGLEVLQHVLEARDLPAEPLRKALRALEEAKGPQPEDLVPILHAHYRLFKKRVLRPDAALRMADSRTPRWQRPFVIAAFKPHQTLNSLLPILKDMDAGLGATWVDALRACRKMERDAAGLASHHGGWMYCLNNNWAGIQHLPGFTDEFLQLVSSAASQATMHAHAVTQLGLRLHELDTGRLPDTLAELVPKYLAIVPEDPYSGEPMRWNAGRKTVYSTGPDGTDDGGHMHPNSRRRSRDDCSVYLWGK